jgi:tetratricopeptide (TPR) repeat protein
MEEVLRQGIAAAKAGQRERARDLLMQVVEQNEGNLPAWLWLSGVLDSLEDQVICLENVLALDPDNQAARKGLAWLREQQATTPPADPEAVPSYPDPAAAAATSPRPSASPAGAMLRGDFARRQPPPEPEPEPPPPPPDDGLRDEYQCPYCAAGTAPDDRTCPACRKPLWIRTRRREERSSWLWIALTLQAANTLWPAFIPIILIFYAGYRTGVHNFFLLAPAYLGLSSQLEPEVVAAAFEWVPPVYVVPFAVYLLSSLAVVAGLYLRWKPIFYLYLVSALFMLASAIGGIAFLLDMPPESAPFFQRSMVLCSGGGVILALFMFALLLQLEDDFFLDERRLLLRQDRDATNGPALLDSGRRYARAGMWALAALHLRRAAGLLPHQIDPPLALCAAYLNLKRYAPAAEALERARRLDPEHPQVGRLASLLGRRRAGPAA